MKKILFTSMLLMLGLLVLAQDKSQRPSPPATASGMSGDTKITVEYSQPAVKGREIWGGLVPYGKIWRAGANESTSIEFSKDVSLDGKNIPAGKYAFFVIPNKDEWTIVLNKTIAWGTYSYKEEEDVVRFNVPAKKTEESIERLTFKVKEGKVGLMWDNAMASFKVK